MSSMPGRRVCGCSRTLQQAMHVISPEERDGNTWWAPQVQPLLEQPIGMALYEYNNGKIGPSCVQGGELLAAAHSLSMFCSSM